MRRTWIACIAAAIAALIAGQASAAERDEMLSRAAAAPVLCLTGEEWHRMFAPVIDRYSGGGAYDTGTREILLRQEWCDRLELLPRRPRLRQTRYELAAAVFLLGHELAHHRGIADERAADCEALRRYRWLLGRLGVRPRSRYAGILYESAATGSVCPAR